MAAPPNTTTVLDCFRVAPPRDAAAELSFPLLQFDMIFLTGITQLTFFYEIPSCSKSHFLETVVPNLRDSLSLTLRHYLPLAGNIVFPPAASSAAPFVRYATGDSLSLTIVESTSDFIHLSSHRPRKASEFDALAPLLPVPIDVYNMSDSSVSVAVPVAAIQITLFPNQGICIGFSDQHSIADGASVGRFLHTWASINRSLSNGPQYLNILPEELLPSFDRTSTSLRTSEGIDLHSAFWSRMKTTLLSRRPVQTKRIENQGRAQEFLFRATFVLTELDIKKIKNFASIRRPAIAHVSSFTIACSYLWVCLVKLAVASEKDTVDDEELEYFLCSANCRALVEPVLPQSYFGNCLVFIAAESDHGTLKGSDGLVSAAEIIDRSIREVTGHPIVDWNKVCENSFMENIKLFGKRALRIAGSSRGDFYAADFGWGQMKQYEHFSSGRHGFMSLVKSRDEIEKGIEIGLSMPKMQLEAFSAIFNNLFKELMRDGGTTNGNPPPRMSHL